MNEEETQTADQHDTVILLEHLHSYCFLGPLKQETTYNVIVKTKTSNSTTITTRQQKRESSTDRILGSKMG